MEEKSSYCAWHPQRTAKYTCAICGKSICKECRHSFSEGVLRRRFQKAFCPECYKKLIDSESPNPILSPKITDNMITKTLIKYQFKVFLFLITLLGSALRIYNLDYKSLWLDEVTYSFILPSKSFTSILPHLIQLSTRMPPLYLLILHFVQYLGTSELILRSPSLIFGILTILTTYIVGKLLFGDAEGLVAAFLFSISVMGINYSQQAIPYSLFLFFSSLSLFFLLKAMKENSGKLWIAFIVSTLIGAYTHYYMLLVALVEAIILVPLLMKKRNQILVGLRKAYNHRKTVLMLSVSGLVLLTIFIIQLAQSVLTSITIGTAFKVPWGIQPTQSFFLDILNAFGISEFTYMFLIFFTLGLLTSIKIHMKSAVIVLLWVFLPIIIVFFISLKLGIPIVTDKYLIFILPVYLIGVSRGICGIVDTLLKWLGSLLIRDFHRLASNVQRQLTYMLSRSKLIVSLLTAILIFSSISITPLEQYYMRMNDDWRGVAGYLRASTYLGDIVIIESYSKWKCLKYYYDTDLNERNETCIDLDMSPENLIELFSKHNRMWFILTSDFYSINITTEETIGNWMRDNFVEMNWYYGIRIYFCPKTPRLIVTTENMSFLGRDKYYDSSVAAFNHQDDCASFNVSISRTSNYTIGIHAKTIGNSSALELDIDGTSKGLNTFVANDWTYVTFGTFTLNAGHHEIMLVNKEGGSLGDTNIIFDQVSLWAD